MSENRLHHATSPYLLQHRTNPVHWWPWGAEAFSCARARNVPVLLSIGYSACHWCHVMAHESFEDPAIAEVVNRLCVPVKVDREEHPHVDDLYMKALHLMGQQGGWPLTMFLSPEGVPLVGGTYFPPSPRHGLTSFPDLVRQVSRLWQSQPAELATCQHKLVQALQPSTGARPHQRLSARALPYDGLLHRLDPQDGGLRGAPKFPQIPLLRLLWSAAQVTGNTALADHVVLTLRHMCRGGIFDHVDGGFARYSVDAHWRVPHFEKMLYDNALILDMLCECCATGTLTEEDMGTFRTAAAETIRWCTGTLSTPQGMAASLDADSEGEEGKFYLWQEAEIRSILGVDSTMFFRAYALAEPGVIYQHGTASDGHRSLLRKLRQARAQRTPPARDDKVVCDWNAMMVAALARAGEVFQTPRWLEQAQTLFELRAQRTRLAHIEGQEEGYLEDYAAMCAAAVALHRSTGEERYLRKLRRWLEVLDSDFARPEGGYFMDASPSSLIVRPFRLEDNATPSGHGLLALALAWLAHNSEPEYQRATALVGLAATADPLPRLFAMPALIEAQLILEEGRSFVLAVGPKASAKTLPLWQAALKPHLRSCDTLTLCLDPKRYPVAQNAVILYICTRRMCLPPLSAPDAIATTLESLLYAHQNPR